MQHARGIFTYSHLSILAVAAAFPAAAFAQQTLYTVNGGANGTNFGTTTAVIGDYNNDGFDDIAVGSPDDDTNGINAGKVTIISGKDGATLLTRYGDASNDQLGFCVSGVGGDANGDGYADFMAGAPYADPNGSSSGLVRVYSGNNGNTIATINGAAAGDRFGYSCAYAGNTGSTRIVIGAPYRDHASADSGSAYLYFYSGSFIHEFSGSQGGEHLGFAVAGGGNISGDSNPDVIVGSPDYDDNGSDTGRVKVYEAASPYTTYYTLPGAGPGNRYGYAVALLGNIDGDGFADFAVGAPEAGVDMGSVQIISGQNGLINNTILGGASNEHFGRSIASVGDITGDGKTEFAVGAPDASTNGSGSGAVRVYLANGTIKYTFNGPGAGAHAGTSVGGGGDFNNDGKNDIVYGCPDTDVNGADTGSIVAKSGSNGATLFTVDGLGQGDLLGSSCKIIGDVNGDGYWDVAIGAPYADHNYFNLGIPFNDVDAGSVKILNGKTGSVMYTLWGSTGDNFGYSISRTGDLNNDGVLDFVVGAPQMSTGTPADPGYVKIFSGTNGALIRTHASVINNDAFGFSVDAESDLTFDGIPDVVIGAPKSSQYGLQAGYVTAYSGSNGAYLWIQHSSIANDWYGYSVGSLGGDVNGGGGMDVVVGAPLNDTNGTSAGRVDILCGEFGGSPFFTVYGSQAGEQFGFSVSGVGDVNLDGKVDALAGAPFTDTFFTTDGGTVKVISGFNGSILQTYYGWTNDYLGWSVARLGDVDYDGRPDYAAGGPQQYFLFTFGTGIVEIISGFSNSRIYQLKGTTVGERFGAAVGGTGNVNELGIQGGVNDVVVGSPWFNNNANFAGRASIVSLSPQGVSYYGTGTPGCAGAHSLKTSGAPNIGNYNFGFRDFYVPTNSLGLLLVTDSQDIPGSDPFGIGVLLHVDLISLTEFFNFDIYSDFTGYGGCTTAVPNDNNIVGNAYYAQALWIETNCTLSPNNVYNLSSSKAVKLVIQP